MPDTGRVIARTRRATERTPRATVRRKRPERTAPGVARAISRAGRGKRPARRANYVGWDVCRRSTRAGTSRDGTEADHRDVSVRCRKAPFRPLPEDPVSSAAESPRRAGRVGARLATAAAHHHADAIRLYPDRRRPSSRGGTCLRGKSGHHRARWSVTPTRGNPRESATEITPPKPEAAAALQAGKGEMVR